MPSWTDAPLADGRYGAPTTYQRAADWLAPCPAVADWGGSTGYLARYLPTTCHYTVVDSTAQCPHTTLADLATYHTPAAGICLRHVLEVSDDWSAILMHAVESFTQRLAVVTYTPPAASTRRHHLNAGWPVYHFNPDDLTDRMQPYLVGIDHVHTTHPECVYRLAR
jgi:hypothetical protein